jgi:hypothetical protein
MMPLSLPPDAHVSFAKGSYARCLLNAAPVRLDLCFIDFAIVPLRRAVAAQLTSVRDSVLMNAICLCFSVARQSCNKVSPHQLNDYYSSWDERLPKHSSSDFGIAIARSWSRGIIVAPHERGMPSCLRF